MAAFGAAAVVAVVVVVVVLVVVLELFVVVVVVAGDGEEVVVVVVVVVGTGAGAGAGAGAGGVRKLAVSSLLSESPPSMLFTVYVCNIVNSNTATGKMRPTIQHEDRNRTHTIKDVAEKVIESNHFTETRKLFKQEEREQWVTW